MPLYESPEMTLNRVIFSHSEPTQKMATNDQAPFSQQPVGNVPNHNSSTDDLRLLRLRGGTGDPSCRNICSLCCPYCFR